MLAPRGARSPAFASGSDPPRPEHRPTPQSPRPAAETRAWIRAAREELKRRYLRRPDPARSLATHAAFVDQCAPCALERRQSTTRDRAGRGRRLRPRRALPLLRRRRPRAASRRPSARRGGRALHRRAVGHRPRARPQRAHGRRVRRGGGEGRHRGHEPHRGAARRGQSGAPRGSREAAAQRRDVRDFFQAKIHEQTRRHERFQEAAYNLEPNIKESPGGLRDLQMVLWLARAAGLGRSWKELARAGTSSRRARPRRSRSTSACCRIFASACTTSRGGARTASSSTTRSRSRGS